MTTLRLILGDQLSADLASLCDCDNRHDTILMCEVWDETQYVRHHPKKIAFLFSAMRHHAQALTKAGYRVRYIRLEDAGNTGSFTGEVERACAELNTERLVLTHPGEYRVLQMMEEWRERLDIPVEIREDDRFLCSGAAFTAWAGDKKQPRMEFFYRKMRKDYNILMDGDKPEGGEWNYDAQNREPPTERFTASSPHTVTADDITAEVLALVERRFSDHFGTLRPFAYAVTREQAVEALHHFIQYRLRWFGDYQDAMVQGEPWMYHSHLSTYLNSGLLTPMECIKAAEEAYYRGDAPLNAVEGFIRQILGWREFIRGIYWLRMPEYERVNALEATRPLPQFYWDANTDMNCLKQCVRETRDHAYAHHIQRLMVLGNFALLAGISPDEVNEWYLIVYADAYQWVELPNVSGMILYADGGYLASKPYAAGGNYINKMSDYCRDCRYKVSKKQGEDACPFNYLYWDFLVRNREALSGNPRVAMMYRSYDRMSESKKQAIAEDSRRFLASLT